VVFHVRNNIVILMGAVGVDTTFCDKVCQRFTAGRWFSPGTPVSSTNKTDSHDITEILLKTVLSTINQTSNHLIRMESSFLKSVSVIWLAGKQFGGANQNVLKKNHESFVITGIS
jgi:hypothetical protein